MAGQAPSINEQQFAMGDFKDILTDLVIEGQNGHNKISDQLPKDERIFTAMQGMLASVVYEAFTKSSTEVK